MEIAFHMQVEYSEPGTTLFSVENNEQMNNNELIIVYSGVLTNFVVLDDKF